MGQYIYINEINGNIVTSLTRLDIKSNDVKLQQHQGHSNIAVDGLASLTINVVETCNMNCSYCFACAGNYGSNYSGVISMDTLVRMVEALLNRYYRGISNFCFFGGEPLIGFHTIKSFVEWICERYKELGLVAPVFSIVTNGTLINKEIIDFLEKHHFIVTISIDGTKDSHDMMRVFKDGSGTYDTIAKNMRMMEYRMFTIFAEVTITQYLLENYKNGDARHIIDNTLDLGFDGLAFFTVDSEGDDLMEYSWAINAMFSEAVDYSFEMLLDDKKYLKVPTNIASKIIHIVKGTRQGDCLAGIHTLFSTSLGDIYPCQLYYQARQSLLCSSKNISEGNLESKMSEFQCRSRYDVSACQECFAIRTCSVWCPGSVQLFKRSYNAVIESRCLAEKAITRSIIVNLLELKNKPIGYQRFIANLKQYSKRRSIKTLFVNQDRRI